MSKVNFKSYLSKSNDLPTDLQLIVSCYGLYLNLREAADCLHRSYEAVYGLVLAGTIKASRSNRKGSYIVSQTR